VSSAARVRAVVTPAAGLGGGAGASGAGTTGAALLETAAACRRRISLSKQASRAAESLTLKHFSMGSKESCVSAISGNNAQLSRINALAAAPCIEWDPTRPLPLMSVPFLVQPVHACEK
jgi:hypothetical protein